MTPRFLLAFVFAAALGGCASGPGIPDTAYFRLPEPAELPVSTDPLDAPLVIDTFLADGVHSDQSLLYSTDPDGDRLRAYHYQLWVDPPTRMLQRRLIHSLDAAKAAPAVLERLPPNAHQYRLSARIDAFERLRQGEQWVVRAALEVRLDRDDRPMPVFVRQYAEQRNASGESVRDSVRALGAAIDAIYAAVARDLQASVSE